MAHIKKHTFAKYRTKETGSQQDAQTAFLTPRRR
jgi:hypothetical protein